MPISPAAKETAPSSTEEAPRLSTSSAAKRLREDDTDMASSFSNQAGGNKKRQICGDVIVKDPVSKLEQEANSRDTIRDEAGTVDGDIEENNKEGDSEFSGPLLDRRFWFWKQHRTGEVIAEPKFCIPRLLRGRQNIECEYRFNLMDRTGNAKATKLCILPNRFFHISCIEHLFDLREFLDKGWIIREGGSFLVGMLRNAVLVQRFHTVIEEWFVNKGSVFTIDEYKAYKEACETREREWSTRWFTHCRKNHEDERHEEQCSCAWDMPEVNKSDYFPEERTPRLLSQVLASLTKVSQIDHLGEKLLARLKDMSAEQGTKLLKTLAETIEQNRERNAGLRSPGSEVSRIDPPTAAEAAAAPSE